MVLEFKAKTATEALEKIAYALNEQHWGCDQLIIDGLHFEMSDVQDYAKATLKNQPQLTLPKSVADELDSDNLLDFVDRVLTPSDLPKLSARYAYSQTHGDWYNIMVTYLNPLTHDFVKVVEE